VKVLVVGSGGREHALAWKIAQSPQLARLWCAPGNAGIASVAECADIAADDLTALADFAHRQRVDLTVVGPEDPLAQGIVDVFQERSLRVFGPSARAAELEASKVFSKRLFRDHGIPSGGFDVFDDMAAALDAIERRQPPMVVKADGLARGKGVTVAHTREEAAQAVREAMADRVFGEAGARLVIEEYLEGPEVTVMAIADGETIVPLAPAQDHKAAFDGDRGPNTGGMGCYSPVPALTDDVYRQAVTGIIEPTAAALRAEGRPYRGVLYAGLILTREGLKVLEFNCRFGDPEAQVVLPRLESDLLELLDAAADGRLAEVRCRWSDRPAVCVVMASGGYPGDYEKGKVIQGLQDAESTEDVVVFHGGTDSRDGQVVTNGGRVLGVTALGANVAQAKARAYEAVDRIHFEGAYCRRDIADKAIHRSR
jgi:phosphoribosylamine--glycine ligase